MLAICALIAKIIGAMYRIPLTNIVGSEGIGLYQMVFPLYTVLLTVSSGGLPVAISRVVAERIAKGDEPGARRVLGVALASLSLAGLVAAGVIVLLRGAIATAQGNPSAAIPYLGIAPSLLFVAVISCFRGYYQGKQNMLPSAVSQLIEQIIKLGAGLYLAARLLPFGVEYGVLGALLGVSVSELVTLLYLGGRFFLSSIRYRKRTKISVAVKTEIAADLTVPQSVPMPKNRALLKEIYRVAIPVTLGSLVMPLTQVIDSVLVINLLIAGGMGRVAATSAFGLMTGPIGTILNMPVVVSLSFAVALLPKVSECFFKKESAGEFVGQSLKYNFVLGLLSTLTLAVFALPILSGLYARGLTEAEIRAGAILLVVGSISVVYVSLLQVATSVLQGTNQAQKPAINLLVGAVVKVLCTLALLPLFGLFGAMAASAACYGVTCVLDIRAMLKTVRPSLKVKEFLLGPLVGGIGFCAFGLLAQHLLLRVLPPLWAVIVAFTAALIFFIGMLAAFGTVKAEELKEFPFIGKLIFRNRKKSDKRGHCKTER